QQGYNAAKAAADSAGAKFQAITNIGYDKTDVILRQLIKGGSNFVVAHASGYDTIATRLARKYKVPMITYDVPTNLTKGYVSYITTSSQEGAYLAGILAAKMTKTHKVWMIGDIGDMTPIDKHHVFLSSVLWSFTGTYNQAIKDINGGTYGTHGYNLSLANSGISLLHTKYISAAAWAAITKAKAQIM